MTLTFSLSIMLLLSATQPACVHGVPLIRTGKYTCVPERQITEIITQTPFAQKRIIIRFFESLTNVKYDLIYN